MWRRIDCDARRFYHALLLFFVPHLNFVDAGHQRDLGASFGRRNLVLLFPSHSVEA